AKADAAISEFAAEFARGRRDRLDRLHALMAAINARMAFDAEATHVATSAPEAFALRRGVCQDFAHVFIAAARLLDAPARYVAGYYLRADGVEEPAGHAWAEAYVEDLGWVGFDATHGVCPGERHVRVAVGLDYLDAAPVRGVREGGGEETLGVALTVADAAAAAQQ
ncbi:MAG: transglutaminase family protein, partial [Hyphomicrobiales bacterium]|nr:transglutaminase family protein [Hyphomicrobiales bacterium]